MTTSEQRRGARLPNGEWRVEFACNLLPAGERAMRAILAEAHAAGLSIEVEYAERETPGDHVYRKFEQIPGDWRVTIQGPLPAITSTERRIMGLDPASGAVVHAN